MPHRLEEQTLLRIHQLSLAVGNAKEVMIKLVDIFHEPSPLDLGLVDFQQWITEVLTPIPTIFGDFLNQRLFRHQIFPELMNIFGAR